MIDSKLQYYKMKFTPDLFLNRVRNKQSYYSNELKSLVFGELPKFEEVRKVLYNWIKM